MSLPEYVFCSRGHRYRRVDGWCPACGELWRAKPVRGGAAECTLIVKPVPRALRTRFRRACFSASTTIREQILAFMDDYATTRGYPPDDQTPSTPAPQRPAPEARRPGLDSTPRAGGG